MRAIDKKSIFYIFLSLYLSQKKKRGGSQSLEENGRYGSLKKQKNNSGGCKDGSEAKCTVCSFRGCEFNSQPLVTHKHL